MRAPDVCRQQAVLPRRLDPDGRLPDNGLSWAFRIGPAFADSSTYLASMPRVGSVIRSRLLHAKADLAEVALPSDSSLIPAEQQARERVSLTMRSASKSSADIHRGQGLARGHAPCGRHGRDRRLPTRCDRLDRRGDGHAHRERANKTGLVDFHAGMSYSELLPKSKALLAAQDYVTAVEGALQRRHSTRAAEGGPRGRADGVRSAARRRIARPSLGPRAGDSAAAFGASRTRAAAAAASCPVQVRRALDTRLV